MKGIRKGRNDLNALGHYVVDNEKIYMAMKNKYKFKCTILTKKIDTVCHEASFQKDIQLCEKIMSRTAERMKTWDTGLAKAVSQDN
jgi:hypothetical protein